MFNTNHLLSITPSLLNELSLLFESAKGGPLPYAATDAGFNCYAKSFVTCYLARLQGIAADHCEGNAFLALRRSDGPATLTCEIEPHAWAGSQWGLVFDLSINHFLNREYLAAGTTPLAGVDSAATHITSNVHEFEQWCAAAGELAQGSHVFLHLKKWVKFRFGDLQLNARRVKSPPTQAIVARYPGNNVLAKSILHLHWLVAGRRDPLRAADQDAAWDSLAAWSVDPLSELRAEWHAAWHGLGWQASRRETAAA